MNKQAFNPFLPSYEYVPDAEPYVFGDRLYIYGSHDHFDGEPCFNDYVCWSAPVNDLSDWCYEGVIYKKNQDPMNKDESHRMFAPDVVIGPDGRYYLYYTLDIVGIMSVAVCDTPAGKYEFYGFVKRPDGSIIGEQNEFFQFDPGVLLDDDGRVYLYSGFAPKVKSASETLNDIIMKRPAKIFGSFVMELEQDMLTVKYEPKPFLPIASNSEGTGFEGHEFFEASSIRKINGKYYFIYSSINSHDLCYAVSDRPDGGFIYGGVIVSIGDIYLDGRQREDSLNYLGNTHGGIVEVMGQWYVLYHRQSNLREGSRQACAEKIYFEADGSIKQVEITSCGLNDGLLAGVGEYEAYIACNLLSKDGCTFYTDQIQEAGIHPYFTQDGPDRESDGNQYIANFCNGATAGFKYFQISEVISISVTVRGNAKGKIKVSTAMNGEVAAVIDINASNDWQEFSEKINISDGKQALYFTYCGEGYLDFMRFRLK